MAQIVEKEDLKSFQWPSSPQAAAARSFCVPLMEQGVEAFVDNVSTKLFLLALGDLVLPLTVNEREYSNSYVASNYYVVHSMREKGRHPLVTALTGGTLKCFQVNKTVILNNWLLSNNLFPSLSESQLQEALACVTARFPDHLVMVRNINTIDDVKLLSSLQNCSFRLIGSREIFVFDPARKAEMTSKVRNHLKRDSRLASEHGYEVVSKKDLRKEDVSRIIELYTQVYVQGFTRFAPMFNAAFLEHALESHLFQFMGVRKEGQIDGIFAYYTLGNVMTTPFFGYDKTSPQAKFLYRMVTILMIEECERLGLLLNNGSGGDNSKLYRGMTLHPEYVAVYDKHLSWPRRLFWQGVEAAMKQKAVSS